MTKLQIAKISAFKLGAIALAISSANASAESLQLEEIIVTAQKRQESVQDVSISVAVVDGGVVADKAMVNLQEVTANLPAVNVSRNVLSQYIFVRGMGTAGIAPAQEQAVAMFTDGIYMGRPSMARAPLMDIDRVEVLRGSQSIFFGKNTMAGAMGIYTKEPTSEFEGKVSALYGTDNETELNAMLSGPLSDTVRGRIAIRKYDIDGWVDNTLPGAEDAVQSDDSTVRLKLAWDISDNALLKASYEKNEFDSTGLMTQIGKVADFASPRTTSLLGLVGLLSGGTEDFTLNDKMANDNSVERNNPLLSSVLGLSPTQLASLPDSDNSSQTDTDLAIVTYEQELGAHSLTVVAGYAQYDTATQCACDNTAMPFIDVDTAESYEQSSLEIRLASRDSRPFEYMVGAFFQASELSYRETNTLGLPLLATTWDKLNPLLPAVEVPNIGRLIAHDQETDTVSLFGSVTWHVTPGFRSVLGLRVQNEQKDAVQISRGYINDLTPDEYDVLQATDPITQGITDPVGFQAVFGSFEHRFEDDLDDDTVSWSVKAEYDLNADGMVYALVSNGSKSGGFDARSVLPQSLANTFSYDSEKALNLEVGLKQDLMNGRMRVNTALFRTKVQDYQVSVYDGTVNFFVDNAGELLSQGLEVDGSFRATESLTISGALSYLDSEWQSFPAAPATALQTLNGQDTQDLKGERSIFAPEWAANLSFNYTKYLGAVVVDGTLDINYSDEFSTQTDMDPEGFYDASTTVNLRLALGSEDGAWQVALIGKNLTDEVKGNEGVDVPLLAGAYYFQIDRLRSWALQGTYHF